MLKLKNVVVGGLTVMAQDREKYLPVGTLMVWITALTLLLSPLPHLSLFPPYARYRAQLASAMDGDNTGNNNDVLDDGRRNRLPTFQEVLSRKTTPPVDLFMF